MPRKSTLNTRLQDRYIAQAVRLQRYVGGRQRETVRFLDRFVFPDVLGKLQSRLERIQSRGFDRGPHTTKRYRNLLVDTREVLREGLGKARKRLSGELRDLAKVEADASIRAMQAEAGPVGVTFRGLDLRTVQAVAGQPVDGQPLAKWWRDIESGTMRRIEREIGTGLAQGETVDQMVTRVRQNAFPTTRRNAEALVRTAATHVSAQAREASFRENAATIKGVQWVSTLDLRTSDVCKSRDGQVWPVGEGPRPPAHPNCRSTVAPVLKSWRELGIDLGEAPEGTRASMDGQVPANLTYGDWLAEQPPERQDVALGPSRARLFRAGRITVADLTTSSGRPLTLDELRES